MFGQDRADDADRIDAGVVVKAAILDREHRLGHAPGISRDRPALLRSPRASAVSTGASRTRRSLGLVASSSRWTRSGSLRRRVRVVFAALNSVPVVAERRRGRPGPSAPGRAADRDRAVADGEFAGLFRVVTVRVAPSSLSRSISWRSDMNWPRRSSAAAPAPRKHVSRAPARARRKGGRTGRSNRWPRSQRTRWNREATRNPHPALAPECGDSNLQRVDGAGFGHFCLAKTFLEPDAASGSSVLVRPDRTTRRRRRPTQHTD